MLGVALDGNDEEGVGLVGVDVDGEAEVGGEVAADLAPGVAGVVGTHDVPVFLHEKGGGAAGMHSDVVDTVADLGCGVGDLEGAEAAVDGLPGLAAVVGAKGSGGRDGDDDSLRVGGVEENGVKAHAAGSGLPGGAGAVFAKAGEFEPGVAAIGRLEECCVFGSGVDGVGGGEGRLEMPDALELPWVRRAVVPLMRSWDAVVEELVADGGPGEAAVVGALDYLSEPAGGLRGVDAVRVYWRTFEVVDLPAGEVGAGDGPVFAGSV